MRAERDSAGIMRRLDVIEQWFPGSGRAALAPSIAQWSYAVSYSLCSSPADSSGAYHYEADPSYFINGREAFTLTLLVSHLSPTVTKLGLRLLQCEEGVA